MDLKNIWNWLNKHASQDLSIVLVAIFILLILGIFSPNPAAGIGIKIAYATVFSLLCFFALVGSSLLRKASLQLLLLVIFSILSSVIIYCLISLLTSFKKLGLDSGQISAIITILVAVFTVVADTIYKQHLDVENERNSKFIPAYENFIDFLVLLRDGKVGPEERFKHISKIDRGMYKWGNYRVRKCWNEIRSDLIDQELLDDSIMQKVPELLLAMRRQVGHPEERDTLTRDFITGKIEPPNVP